MDAADKTESPQSNGRISIAIAAPHPLPPLAIDVPAQIPRCNSSGSFPFRVDCWTESATFALINAWGERYLHLGRGNLSQQHWKEVADAVAAAGSSPPGKFPKTALQCKNRIDTVKKRYKSEKAGILAGGPPSRWPFFNHLDRLLGSSTLIQALVEKKNKGKRQVYYDSDSDTDPPSQKSTDNFPAEMYPSKRAHTQLEMSSDYIHNNEYNCISSNRDKGSSMRELARAIVEFGEMYERVEISKCQQMVEMEKQRIKFDEEMEIKRMQSFMKTQSELLQLVKKRKGSNNNQCDVGENSGNRHDHSDHSS